MNYLFFTFWYISLTVGIVFLTAVRAAVVTKPVILDFLPSMSFILLSESIFQQVY